MKTTQEVETVEIKGVKLDVYFTYHPDFGFEIEDIETLTDIQGISHLLAPWVVEAIENKLHGMYESRGWL